MSKKPRLAITALSFLNSSFLIQEFKRTFSPEKYDIKTPPLGKKNWQQDELILFLQDVDFAIVGREKMDRELLKNTKLCGIAKYGVGLDNIDFTACAQKNVQVFYKEGVNAPYVAEHTLAVMLSLLRKINEGHSFLKNGTWKKNGGISLYRKKVAVIGCGHVGSALCRLLLPFQCQLFLVDIKDVTTLTYEVRGAIVSLEKALQEADIVSLHVPLTHLTRQMINKERLSSMRPESFIINTSRGEVVDEKALLQSLQEKKLKGAALDVFENEPEIDKNFSHLDNIILTPHIAGNCEEAVLAMGLSAIESLQHLLCKNIQ